MAIGILASTDRGYPAIDLFLYLRSRMMHVFIWYRIALGLFLLALLDLGIVQPLG